MTHRPVRTLLVGLMLAAPGCGDDGGAAGQETSPCVDGLCLGDLVCLSDKCVAPGGTTDEPTTGEPEGNIGAGQPCNPYTQDCIPGYKCHPQGEESDFCVKIDDNPVEVGGACKSTKAGGLDSDTCVEGAFCDHVEAAEDVCLPMCKPPIDQPSCPSPDTICHAYMGGKAPVCRKRCDPLNIVCPLAGHLCIPSGLDNGFFCFSPYNKFDYGEVCYSAINSCINGLQCVPDEAFPPGGCIGGDYGCCSYLCDLTAPACPAQVPNCVPWWPPAMTPAGDEHIGYCSV